MTSGLVASAAFLGGCSSGGGVGQESRNAIAMTDAAAPVQTEPNFPANSGSAACNTMFNWIDNNIDLPDLKYNGNNYSFSSMLDCLVSRESGCANEQPGGPFQFTSAGTAAACWSQIKQAGLVGLAGSNGCSSSTNYQGGNYQCQAICAAAMILNAGTPSGACSGYCGICNWTTANQCFGTSGSPCQYQEWQTNN